MTAAAAAIVSCLYVFLKAAQQLHVVCFEYRRILPTSLGMAACEVFLFANVVRTAEDVVGLVVLAVCMGGGAGLGCLAAMWLHQRRRAR